MFKWHVCFFLGYRWPVVIRVWSASALDWNQPSVSKMVEYLEEGTKNKANILLHDGGGERPNTVAAVQAMMPKWVKRGYTFEAVPACTKSLS